MFAFDTASSSPLIIESIELLRIGRTHVVRSRSSDGAVGIAATTQRIDYLHPLLSQRVAPSFLGQDARRLEELVDAVYRYQSNYKLVGLPFWSCVAWVEFSLIDLLGRAARRPASELLGPARRSRIPVYLSALGRGAAPRQLADELRARLDRTGAQAVKVKIGGRMSENADATPGRTEELIDTLRRKLPDHVGIYADANGSYDADTAIRVGRMLEAHGVGLFEEPCPFEKYDETRRVAATLDLPVAGGEQDSSVERWKQMLTQRVVDVPQPDLVYNGGFVRTARVIEMARNAGLPVSLHNPHTGAIAAYALHLACVMPNPWHHHEFNVDHRDEPWYEPRMSVSGGTLAVPAGPGLGVEFDPVAVGRATMRKRVRHLARVVVGWVPGLRHLLDTHKRSTADS